MKTRRIDPYRVDIEQEPGMLAPGRVFADDDLFNQISRDGSLKQVANVAHLPGIIGRSMAMPDIHSGYGFPIGGVAAFDYDQGVVSPGGVGYDINCGVRVMTTTMDEADIRPCLREVVERLYLDIPTGVGKSGPVKLSKKELVKALSLGAAWAVKQGFGEADDLEKTESRGAMPGADPGLLSPRALERGMPQLGTLGSGNHFLEIGVVDEVFDARTAAVFGLGENQVTIMLHSGSRGLGYQVCDDFLKHLTRDMAKSGLRVPDRQLACAYIQSKAGQDYLAAMAVAANYAWLNRQIMMHFARESVMTALGIGPREAGIRLLYDVAHNIAKKEVHVVDGEPRTVCVHRKGATRAFPAGHPDVPAPYRSVGQPVLIPGDMGRASFILVGAEGAMAETFGSSCHGAGRVLSRTAAKKKAMGRSIGRELEDNGILVRYTGRSTMAEEMPEAYKDVSQVVDVVHQAGLARKVARIRPIGVIKG